MSRLTPQVNTIYASIPLGFNILMVKSFGNYPYMEGSNLKNSGSKQIYRYAKDYSIDNLNFSLLMISTVDNSEDIEEFFDKTIIMIKETDDYKSMLANLSQTPVNLNIKYGE